MLLSKLSKRVKDSSYLKTLTKDTTITIEINEGENFHPIGIEQLRESGQEQQEYKGFTIKRLTDTGEYDVYAPGGNILTHAKTLELAKQYIDERNVDVEQ